MDESPPIFALEEQRKPEMAHVLFADIVGYSMASSDEQPRLQSQLWQAARGSPEYERTKAAGKLISLPTGDGMALVFTGENVCGPIRAALEIAAALKDNAKFGLRMGLHSGPLYRVLDINGSEGAAGDAINLAQRVMDCGDAGHILLSAVHASFVSGFGAWRQHLHDLGEAEVKHGIKLHLFNFADGSAGNATRPSKFSRVRQIGAAPAQAEPPPQCAGARVVIIYKRYAEPDEILLATLERELTLRGCEVFIDRHLSIGLNWAREIEKEIRRADAVIPLLSPAATQSEMLATEIEIADEAAQSQGGKPRLLPIRVNWEGPLPAAIADLLNPILNPVQYCLWRGPEDTASVLSQIVHALATEPADPARRTRQLEPPGGAMPLESRFYIERNNDHDLHEAIARRDSVVLVEGARQMGKTSLLARGLQRARKNGAKVACTDFQKFNVSDLATLDAFYLTLGTALANQLDLEKFPEDVWRAKSGPNENFERYLRREVLGRISVPLVWGLDEADRLFTCPFGGEVFGLFRSWHNARALDPDSPWQRFTQIICYATEAHLFITDINQSPFNIGTHVALRDFTPEETRQLNTLYGGPLDGDAALAKFQRLFGGQPYLTRRALHELVSHRLSLEQLEATAATEEGPFADHLKRYLVLLSRDQTMLQAVQDTVSTHKFPEPKIFHRLRAAGLLRGATPKEARFRCEIYETYLQRHLPG